jgi:capsule assembly protein Wzi/PAP2 superfamily protein
MGQKAKSFAVVCCLLAWGARSATCYARPQASAAATTSTDESGGRTPRETADKSVDKVAENLAEKTGVIAEPALGSPDRDNRVGLPLLKNIALDQKALWIGPSRLRFVDAGWLVPLGGATAAMLATDTEYSKHLSNSPNRIKYSKDLSKYGLGAMGGVTGGLWLWGHLTHDDHKIETGVLAGEAGVDSMAVFYPLKYAFGRERPLTDAYRGRFGVSGNSFPSGHATLAWSMASVIAHEYPGPLTSLFAYGLASAVSASRITAKQHFPSDVFVGSAIGWLEGMYVYRKHHDTRLGGGEWETYAEAHEERAEARLNSVGSPYVPLDSWIYPAFERLIALGYVDTAALGLRPWTRLECARLLGEAADHYADGEESSEAGKLYESLVREFGYESRVTAGEKNEHAQVESVYARFTSVSGPPLTDDYHFGQTVINDFGRPFERGLNSVDGVSGWAAAGPFVIYARGEYQHAPDARARSQAVLAFISGADGTPAGAPANPISTTNRFRLLDAYVGMNFANWQMSFGQQSLWWGPNESGPFLFSDNAEPIPMFRVTRTSPFRLPWVLRLLGDIRAEFFVGQLSGHEFLLATDNTGSANVLIGQFGRTLNPQPFVNGQKLTFKFTRNLELGLSKTSVFSGQTQPLTFNIFARSIYDWNKVNGQSPIGDGRTAVDFSYRIPKLRDWLTFYGEGFSEDELSPIAYPKKSVWQAGLYMPKLPRLSRLDLRVEGGTTSPLDFPGCNGCFYQNSQYFNSYTNNNQLIGAALGRAAQGEEIRSNYWLSSKSRIGIQLRHRKRDGQFLPGGGTQNDASVNADLFIRSSFSVSTAVQYESWQIPLLVRGRQSDVAASIQLTFWPGMRQ